MTLRTYHVRHLPKPCEHDWIVELENAPVCTARSQVDAIAAAIEAARWSAGEGVETRVTLQHEAGFSYTLSRFSERIKVAA